jgi:hypothetical protein
LECCFGPLNTIGSGLGCELRVNAGVLIDFLFDREAEALLEDCVLLIDAELGGIAYDQFRVEQAEMGEGMLSFLGSSFAEEFASSL